MNVTVIVGILALLPTIAGMLYGVRHRVSAEAYKAAAEAHESNTKAERERGDRLERDLADGREREQTLRDTIKKLEALPDLTIVVQQLQAERDAAALRTNEAVDAILARFDEHETRSQDRHEAQMKLGQALVDKLAA